MKLNKQPSVLMERRICRMPWDFIHGIETVHKCILVQQNVWNMFVNGILPRFFFFFINTPHPPTVHWHALLYAEWNNVLMLFDLLPSLVKESIETLPEAMLSHWTNCELETKSSGFQYNYWTGMISWFLLPIQHINETEQLPQWVESALSFGKISIYFPIFSYVIYTKL